MLTVSATVAADVAASSLSDGLIGVLIGAVIGGAATFGASWWQTGRILGHERELARAASEAERGAARAAVARSAAGDLLQALFMFDAALPKLHHASIARRPDVAELHNSGRDAADVALDALRRGELVGAPLAGDQLAERWSHLRTLAIEYAIYVGMLPESWPEDVVCRAEVDLRSYAEYVRQTLRALIDAREPPADCVPPDAQSQRREPVEPGLLLPPLVATCGTRCGIARPARRDVREHGPVGELRAAAQGQDRPGTAHDSGRGCSTGPAALVVLIQPLRGPGGPPLVEQPRVVAPRGEGR